jgi:hypothetical protein
MSIAPLDTDYAAPRTAKPPWGDRYLFVVVFLMGAAALVTLKLLGFGQAVVTAATVAFMLAYAAHVGLSRRYRLRADRAGDSLYYLGFLYTMVSLAYSLYEFGHGGGTESVVTNFGVALTTTILGLTLRVFFQQLRDDPFDVEREVQADLNDAAREFRFQLLSAVNDLGGLRLAVTQSVTEATTATSKAAVQAMGAVADTFRAAVTDMVDSLKENHEALRAQQEATRASVERVGQAVDRLAQKLDALDVPAAAMKARLDSLTGRFTDLVTALEARTRTEKADGEALDDLRKSTKAIAETLKTELEALSAATADHRLGVRAALGALTEGAASLRSTAEGAIRQSEEDAAMQRRLHEELLTSSREALASVQHTREDLQGAVKSSVGMVNEVHSSLASMTRLLRDELGAKRTRP